MSKTRKVMQSKWWIQDFSEGVPIPEKGANLLFGQFSRKLHENEEILGRRGRIPRAP